MEEEQVHLLDPVCTSTVKDETFPADLFRTKCLFIAGTRYPLLIVALKQKLQLRDVFFLLGPAGLLLSLSSHDGWCKNRTHFPESRASRSRLNSFQCRAAWFEPWDRFTEYTWQVNTVSVSSQGWNSSSVVQDIRKVYYMRSYYSTLFSLC